MSSPMRVSDLGPELNLITEQIIGACIEVHRGLGPGLLESAYQRCLAHELSIRNVSFEAQHPLPLSYKGLDLDTGYRLDLLVEGKVIVEIKAAESLLPIHDAQVITYLKLSNMPAALLINFHVARLVSGIRRFANTRSNPSFPSAPPQ